MSRASELRDALGAPTALDKDDRTFEEQMADIGVEVVKPKVTWYKTMTQRSGKVGLKDKISLTKSCLTFGGEVVGKIGADSLLNFGLYEKNGKKYIAMRTSKKDGLKLSKTKANSYRVGSQALAKWLLEQGMPLGKYRLQEIKGGWLAVPEGKR
jgi:phage antirepressor YoqD-like protein